jgi:hypothetical protein
MEAIRFKPQSESRFVSNPIAPGVGQINSGILTLSGSIHSRNLTITSIHKVGQTIPGIPGSDDSRNKWVRLFPEYMGELIPGIGGSEVSGIFSNYKDNKMSGEWKILNNDSSTLAAFQFEDGYNVSLLGKWLSDKGVTFELLNDGTYNFKEENGNSGSGRYEFNDDLVLSFLTNSRSYYMITAYNSSKVSMTGARISDDFAPQPDPNVYTWTRISN